MSNVSEIAVFASRFGISAQEAYVLPAVFERTAQVAKMPVRAFIAEATFRNHKLGEYLANVARKVAADDKAAH